MILVGFTCATGSRARSSRSALDHPRYTPAHRLPSDRCSPSSSPAASPSFRSGCTSLTLMRHDSSTRRIPGRPARRQMGSPPLRIEAGEPGEPAQVHGHRRRHRPGRRVGGRRRSASSATTSRASASTTARGARTASPRRAASTPRRTTRTTATASSGCSTTPSRAATTDRARRTSTGSRS